MVKRKAILAPLGVLAGLAVFAAIGYGLLNVGISSMDTWVDETAVLADNVFSGKATAATGAAGSQAATTIASPASTAPQAGQIAAAALPQPTEPAAEDKAEEKTREETTYVTAEGFSGTIAPDHVVHDGETWISRVDSNGKPYYRTSVYLPAPYYGQEVDLADYGSNCYFVAQDGQPVYFDDDTGTWVLVEYYDPWVSPW